MIGSGRRLSLLWLEPHDGGSHRAIVQGFAKRTRHRVVLRCLPARNWKWRLRAAGLRFALERGADLARADVIVASSLLNLADVAAATRRARGGRAPLVLVMHESQVAYPVDESAGFRRDRFIHPDPRERDAARRHRVTEASGTSPRDWGLAFADLSAAAAADRILFNSRHHREAFLAGGSGLIAAVPDGGIPGLLRRLRAGSRVCAPGFEDSDIPAPAPGDLDDEAPIILWNHRWEFDKAPDEFFAVLERVRERGGRFRLALLGASARVVPTPFLRAGERFAAQIVHSGFVPRRADYVRWLRRSALIVSTSHHENFGISWLEAMAAGAWPLLPDALCYPEMIPARQRPAYLYTGPAVLEERLLGLLADPARLAAGRAERSRIARRFSWRNRIAPFEREIGAVAGGGRAR